MAQTTMTRTTVAEIMAKLASLEDPKIRAVKKNPHAEELRLVWFADSDPVVASAGGR